MFHYIQKDSTQTVKSSNLSHAVFIDTSGSTSYYSNSKGQKYIDIELSITKIIKNNVKKYQFVGWSNNPYVAKDDKLKVENMGTNPSCIFRNEESSRIFEECEVLVFLTDGQIGQKEVEEFANNCKYKLNKTLVLCGLVFSDLGDRNNISVFAPLFDCANVICFLYNAEVENKAKILMNKGCTSKIIKDNDYYNLNNLFDLTISNIYSQIPKSHIVCNETDTEIMSIDIVDFITYVKSENCEWEKIASDVEKMDWSVILRNAKVNNITNVIRDVISKLKNLQSQYVKKLIKSDCKMISCDKRDALVAQIVKLRENNEPYEHLTHELNELINLARIEETEFHQSLKSRMGNSTKMWDKIRDELYELEKGSYSLKDFVFSSNRANRAQIASSEELDELENVISYDNCPEIDCCIHLDKGPAVLWMRKPANDEIAVCDHCINFPFDCYPDLQYCFIVNPICGDCAKGYMKAQSTSIYKEQIDGYIPLNIEDNKKYCVYKLSSILCHGKMLPHIKSLLLSMVDDNNQEWFKEYKKHLQFHLIKSIYTTDTFTEEGEKMAFSEAIKKLPDNEQSLLHQPFYSACRLLNFHARLYPNYDLNRLVTIAKRRFSYFLVENRSFTIKPKGNREEEIELLEKYNEKVNELLFDTICGIPVQGTAKSVKFANLESFLGTSWGYVNGSIHNIAQTLNLSPDWIINKEFLTFTLYGLSSYPKYDKPLAVFTRLLCNNFFLNAEHQTNEQNVLDLINKDKFDHYKHPAAALSPAFAFYNGINSTPSKLFFNTKKLWTSDMENKYFDLETVSNMLNSNLEKKLRENYGGFIPAPNTSHTNVHRIVSTVLEQKFPNNNNIQDQNTLISMVMECLGVLRDTKGQRGNMYALSTLCAYVYAIFDFCELRKKYKKSTFVETQNGLYNTTKLKTELGKYGIVPDDSNKILFDSSKFSPPEILSEKYSHLDAVEILKNANDKYNKSKSNNSHSNNYNFEKPLSFHSDEIIAINMNFNLDMWDEEQMEVVNKITLKDAVDFDNIRFYAGCDISFDKNDPDKAVAAFAIFDNRTDKVVADISIKCKTNIPYKAGYLAFREAPILLKLLDKVKDECNEFMPELIIFDGNGIWHPRKCGIASHFSVLSGIPAFGVAKSVLVVPGVTKESVYEAIEKNANVPGAMMDITDKDNNVIGCAFNTTGNAKSSIFISAGNGISLETAKKITRRVTKFAVTEPVRRADLMSRELLGNVN